MKITVRRKGPYSSLVDCWWTDVRAASELEIEAGVVVEVGDISGMYGTPGRIQTDPLFAEAVLTALDRIEVPIERGERPRLERRAGKR